MRYMQGYVVANLVHLECCGEPVKFPRGRDKRRHMGQSVIDLSPTAYLTYLTRAVQPGSLK